MKCQILFSRKNNKNISVAEFAHSIVSVNVFTVFTIYIRTDRPEQTV